MANFQASYEAMEDMASRLDAGREEIDTIFKNLQNEVDELLGESFKTEQASGKFGEGYTQMTEGFLAAMEGVTEMGESLRKIVAAIQETDAALAGS